jgi:hypothetical protein
VHDQNRNRLALITQRFAARDAARRGADRRAFEEAFLRVRDAVIRPVLEEVAEALRGAGHAPRVSDDEAEERPSVELHLGIRGRCARNLVGYALIERRGAPEVLAYLDVDRPCLDLMRYAHPSEITAERVEQLVVDAVEHIFACNAR